MTDISTPPRLLQRVDPSQNLARFYMIAVLPTLFGTASVLRSWGRIGSKGRQRIDLFECVGDAEHASTRLLQAKGKRGYREC
ncbi:WGR domain-containing protein (plasmid) [Nitrobacteraceae bacterium UC4446_H13]